MLRPFGSDCSAMAMNDALDGCEAYAGAFELVSPVQPLEDTEQLVGILHVEADTIVFYEDL